MQALTGNSGYHTISDYQYERDNLGVSKPYSPHTSYLNPTQDDSRQARRRSRNIRDTLHTDEVPQWYWQCIAILSQWMILGGFLILPAAFDKTSSANLRFSDAAQTVVIIALLTGGYSLSGLLWFAVPSPVFRHESVLFPVACISAFSLLATLYSIASSTRYDLTKPSFAVAITLTTISTVFYSIMAFLSFCKLSDTARPQGSAPSIRFSFMGNRNTDSPAPDYTDQHLRHESNYYANYNANMRPSSISFTPPSHNTTSAYPPPPPSHPRNEDEIVNQNLENLLLRRSQIMQNSDVSSNKSTYHLDWPVDANDGEDEIDPRTGRRRQPTFNPDGTVNRGPRRKRTASAGARNIKDGMGKVGRMVRGASASRASGDLGQQRGRSSTLDPSVRTGDAGGKGHSRNASREERRREIEMSNVS